MLIKDLQAKQGSVELTADVVEKGEVRQFQKFGTTGRVCNATIADESGTLKLTLWNDQVDQVNAGDKIKITNGYVNEWQGEKQLTTGKFGKLDIIQKGAGQATTSASSSSSSSPSAASTSHSADYEEDGASSKQGDEDELFDVEDEEIE